MHDIHPAEHQHVTVVRRGGKDATSVADGVRVAARQIVSDRRVAHLGLYSEQHEETASAATLASGRDVARNHAVADGHAGLSIDPAAESTDERPVEMDLGYLVRGHIRLVQGELRRARREHPTAVERLIARDGARGDGEHGAGRQLDSTAESVRSSGVIDPRDVVPDHAASDDARRTAWGIDPETTTEARDVALEGAIEDVQVCARPRLHPTTHPGAVLVVTVRDREEVHLDQVVRAAGRTEREHRSAADAHDLRRGGTGA